MHQKCVTVMYIKIKFLRILYICYIVTTDFDNLKLIQGQQLTLYCWQSDETLCK